MTIPKLESSFPWAISDCPLVGRMDGDVVLMNIKHNYNHDLTQSDKLRLHHDLICATLSGAESPTLYQLNLKIDEAHLDLLYNCAKLGLSHLDGAINTAIELEKQNLGVELAVNKVEISESLATEVATVGTKHWNNILNGIEPEFSHDKKYELSDTVKQQFIAISKEVLVTSQLNDAIKERSRSAKSALHNFAAKHHIYQNIDLPYKGAQLRTSKNLDLPELGNVLESDFDIPPSHLRDKSFDMQAIENELSTLGININKYATFADFNKDKVLTAATNAGIDIENFQTLKMTVAQTSQTRGPIYDAKVEIRQSADQLMDDAHKKLTKSQTLNHPAFFGFDHRLSTKTQTQTQGME